ncbi:hypothetical protein LTR62_000130 [Meristemomyces frigidus]|uniref:Uncharacterized protein n=1 Tax=Meristemomyces frigidus TaxID=1508187 RepID=A0AAN7TSD9_9PEZI|nr:hypothetical protein LTR62_000130 [Meristemomyces frigidus]
MSSVVDFAPSQEIAGEPQSSHAPPHHRSSQRSATLVDQPLRDRRGSTISRRTTMSSPEGMRHRRATRSNTVTTYHEHQEPENPFVQPGAEPGIDTSATDDTLPAHLATLHTQCQIRIIDFSDVDIHHVQADNDSLLEALEEPRSDDLPCRWISVNGLSWDVIRALGNRFSLHRLAVEDMLHTRTRTKVDWYADHAYVVLTLQKLVRLHYHKGLDGKCDCTFVNNLDDDEEFDEKDDLPARRKTSMASYFEWQNKQSKAKATKDMLPRFNPQYVLDSKLDDYVQAHSGTSEETPIKPIRTLHRYESAQIPEHTAFMEKHGVLAEENLAVSVEQVSLFLLADNTVISFFEHSAEDIERPLLERLQSTATMLRRSCDASFMLQAIVDAIVDLAVPVKDAYNKARKELQVDAMTTPNIKTSRALHIFGEEIDMLQNLFKPIVHLVNALRDHQSEPLLPSLTTIRGTGNDGGSDNPNIPSDQPHPLQHKRDRVGVPIMQRKISEFRRTPLRRNETATTISITPLAHMYFGDVLDNCITMIQTMEQMDASASNISTLIFNTVGAKTNNFMMILAVVTVFFAPLTFISGYFGMNFSSGAGLAHPFAFFWVVAIPSLVTFMLIVFATMLWDNISDFFAKRGIRAHRRLRDRNRRAVAR